MPTRQASQHKVIQRGDAPMKNKTKIIPNIVKTYQFEGTTVHIADNFVARTDEEKARIDEQLMDALMVIFRSEARRSTTGG